MSTERRQELQRKYGHLFDPPPDPNNVQVLSMLDGERVLSESFNWKPGRNLDELFDPYRNPAMYEVARQVHSELRTAMARDRGVDLTTAAGRMVAHNLMGFAQYERELISERTKAGLAAKKARGERLGRKRLAPAGVVRRIVKARDAGASFPKIAAALEGDGVLSPAGLPKWQPSTVRRIYTSATAATELEDAS